MGKRIDIAERLKELGFDPVEGMVRIAKAAEEKNPKLAAKIMADLLEYTAPKLKSMELSIDPDTRDFLKDRQQRLERIRTLARQVGLATVIEGECTEVPVLLHKPDTP